MIIDRLRQILLEEPTGNIRFFFGFISIGYALFIPKVLGQFEYRLAVEWIDPMIWAAAFMTNGIALIWGAVANKPTPSLFVLEGVLGALTWGTMGVATSFSQGMPGPTLLASIVACWIFVRYPKWK